LNKEGETATEAIYKQQMPSPQAAASLCMIDGQVSQQQHCKQTDQIVDDKPRDKQMVEC